MRRFLLFLMLAVSLGGFVKAQVTTGRRADPDDKVKKEMLKYENDLVQALLKGGSFAADFIDRVDADDEVLISDGKPSTKASLVDSWRSGDHKQLSVDHHNFRVHVYGNTAVVTFSGNNTTDNKGKVSHTSYIDTDVLVKQEGEWRRVVHVVSPVRIQ
jgi:ketosteroid isomerase-like protein